MSTGNTRHRNWRRYLVLAAIPALGTGCSASNDELTIDFDGIVLRDNPNGGIWLNNGLSNPSLSGIDPAHPLSSPQGMSEVDGVLVNEPLAAQYLVECALPSDQSIVKDVGGEQIVLHGLLGLAPSWRNGTCNQGCQEWVSACLLARTNTNPHAVTISLRGDHPALGFEGHPDYPVYEGSFFGNLFANAQCRHLCRGSAEAAALAQQDGRTCSSDPASCGFVAYDDCEEEERCDFDGEDGDVTAIDCKPAGSNTEYNTISVYVMDPEGNDDDD